jgi:hypothetical protein
MREYIPPWFQEEISRYALKEDLGVLEKKLQKKVNTACDKLSDVKVGS